MGHCVLSAGGRRAADPASFEKVPHEDKPLQRHGVWYRRNSRADALANLTKPAYHARMNHLQQGELAAPTVVDVEASGFGRASYPIEVGVVLPDGHSFCSLIQPETDWTHWDPQAEKVHHISRELLLRRGRPALAVARQLNTLLRGQTVYTDGWANDYSWLARLFDVADMQPAFKLENLRLLLLEHQVEHWHEVKNEVAHERGPQRHRASADARVLQLTLQRIRTRFGSEVTNCLKTGDAAANP